MTVQAENVPTRHASPASESLRACGVRQKTSTREMSRRPTLSRASRCHSFNALVPFRQKANKGIGIGERDSFVPSIKKKHGTRHNRNAWLKTDSLHVQMNMIYMHSGSYTIHSYTAYNVAERYPRLFRPIWSDFVAIENSNYNSSGLILF
jgi:hypothetical protein